MSERETGIDPELKRKINEQGFEGDAAVLVGKEEEMEQLRERLETSGEAADLGTYIKMHKQITAPREYVVRSNTEGTPLERGLTNMLFVREGKGFIEYIDSKGNIARVDIDCKKIHSIRKRTGSDDENSIKKELTGLGFSFTDRDTRDQKSRELAITIDDIFAKARKSYYEDLEKQQKERKKEEFNF